MVSVRTHCQRGNISRCITVGIILRLVMIIKLMKIQKWSKFSYGSKVRNNTEKVIINNAGIGQPANLSGCYPVVLRNF